MSKTFLGILSVLAILSANAGNLYAAEEPAPSEEELTLHPGDMITWEPFPLIKFGLAAQWTGPMVRNWS